ncbi:hypothetical protein [Shinella sp.]|uniref:hypothetical protein n=1 Tax=Shinella sp. TaxID=1870904 RepID=UPI003D2650F4
MDSFRSNGPHDRGPGHGPGFRLGPHRPPHHDILAGLEFVSAQVTESNRATKADFDALNARLDRFERLLAGDRGAAPSEA